MTAPPIPDAPVSHGPQPFRLQHYFSVMSLVGIVVVTACLFAAYRELTIRNLIDHESRANADQTRALANSVWHRYRDFVRGSKGRSREALSTDPSAQQLHADVMAKMGGLQIAKVKIYNLDGLTVFSTDTKQIGEDKSANPGLRTALAGQVVSEITYRDKFDAFEGTLNNRNLIASYVPVRDATQASVEGVVEVYSDVTDLLHKQSRAQWQVAGMVLVLLFTLYTFLLLVVRKADRVIKRQQHEREVREGQVRHQAYHDALTGLPNRAYFGERLGEAISLAQRHGHTCGLMFIDLDRFKIVNDSLGHQAGDTLLKEVALRISGCLRNSDLLFRMGGDEFTVILPQVTTAEDGAFVARRILEAVARPVAMREHELTVGATIGIAVYPGDGQGGDELLKNADAAMYSAKKNGRGSYAFYRTAMNERAMQRLDLEAALKKGFHDGEFTLYYQPRLDAATRRVVAVEALLRWVRPGRGVVAPGEFIPVLEEVGMMTMVGEWVLRSACSQARRWHDQGLVALRVSVNVSSVQFERANFAAVVERVLDDTGVCPAQIELELTESLLIADTDGARVTISALRALGVRISIDDFGTGYSSLNYLRHLMVDYLKIDRCFVTEIASNARDRAVATAIIELANALNISVVAEGVETEAQAAFFTGARCGELQGFLFSKPLPPDQLAHLLAPETSFEPACAAAT